MQLANVTLRLSGSLENTVPKLGITPAEILVLQHLHGSDAVVDVRPAGEDKKLRHDQVYARLSGIYDRGAGAFTATAGEERKSVMETLFPGAVKRLPMTLADIGFGTAAPAPDPVVAPDIPETDEDDPELAPTDEAPADEEAAK